MYVRKNERDKEKKKNTDKTASPDSQEHISTSVFYVLVVHDVIKEGHKAVCNTFTAIEEIIKPSIHRSIRKTTDTSKEAPGTA